MGEAETLQLSGLEEAETPNSCLITRTKSVTQLTTTIRSFLFWVSLRAAEDSCENSCFPQLLPSLPRQPVFMDTHSPPALGQQDPFALA